VSEWISVDDRMPEPYEPVFVVWNGLFAVGVRFDIDVWFVDKDWPDTKTITHWLPIPDLPEGVR